MSTKTMGGWLPKCLRLSTRGRWVVKNSQKSVYVVVECPLCRSLKNSWLPSNKPSLHWKNSEHAFMPGKGAFNNYVDRFLAIFDHPPTPCRQT